MTPTDEQFEAVRRLRREIDKLMLALTAKNGIASIVHVAFDRGVEFKPPHDHAELLRKIQ